MTSGPGAPAASRGRAPAGRGQRGCVLAPNPEMLPQGRGPNSWSRRCERHLVPGASGPLGTARNRSVRPVTLFALSLRQNGNSVESGNRNGHEPGQRRRSGQGHRDLGLDPSSAVTRCQPTPRRAAPAQGHFPAHSDHPADTPTANEEVLLPGHRFQASAPCQPQHHHLLIGRTPRPLGTRPRAPLGHARG